MSKNNYKLNDIYYKTKLNIKNAEQIDNFLFMINNNQVFNYIILKKVKFIYKRFLKVVNCKLDVVSLKRIFYKISIGNEIILINKNTLHILIFKNKLSIIFFKNYYFNTKYNILLKNSNSKEQKINLDNNIIESITEVKNVIILEINNNNMINYQFFNNFTFEKINFEPEIKNNNIIEFREIDNIFMLLLKNQKYLFYNLVDLKKINFQNIADDDKIYNFEIMETFYKIKTKKTYYYNKSTFKLYNFDKINEIKYFVKHLIIIKYNWKYTLFLNYINLKKIKLEYIKDDTIITSFKIIKGLLILYLKSKSIFIYNFHTLKIIKFNGINYKNDIIVNINILKEILHLKLKNKLNNFYNWNNLELINFNLKTNEKITNFKEFNNFLEIQINNKISKFYRYELNLNNIYYILINTIEKSLKNFKIKEIKEYKLLLRILTINFFNILFEIKSFGILKFKGAGKTNNMTEYVELDKHIKIKINNNYRIYHKKTLKKLNINNNYIITNILKNNNFYVVELNKKYFILFSSDFSLIKLKNINRKILSILIEGGFIKVKIAGSTHTISYDILTLSPILIRIPNDNKNYHTEIFGNYLLVTDFDQKSEKKSEIFNKKSLVKYKSFDYYLKIFMEFENMIIFFHESYISHWYNTERFYFIYNKNNLKNISKDYSKFDMIVITDNFILLMVSRKFEIYHIKSLKRVYIIWKNKSDYVIDIKEYNNYLKLSVNSNFYQRKYNKILLKNKKKFKFI